MHIGPQRPEYVGVQDGDARNGSAGYPDVGKARIDWTPFIFGFIPHIAAWSIVACHFFRNVKEGDDTPGFVWAIIFILFILDGMFALVQFLQFKQVKFLRGFARAEFFYIILRYVALCYLFEPSRSAALTGRACALSDEELTACTM